MVFGISSQYNVGEDFLQLGSYFTNLACAYRAMVDFQYWRYVGSRPREEAFFSNIEFASINLPFNCVYVQLIFG